MCFVVVYTKSAGDPQLKKTQSLSSRSTHRIHRRRVAKPGRSPESERPGAEARAAVGAL